MQFSSNFKKFKDGRRFYKRFAFILVEVDSRLVKPHERHFHAFVRRERLAGVIPDRVQEFIPPSAKKNKGKVKFKSQEVPHPKNM